ncbi:MAG: hypothetical protein HQK67_02145 [Desulfamplus sp.]|nr:hypothetical protein [Desulfamplus sp.]
MACPYSCQFNLCETVGAGLVPALARATTQDCPYSALANLIIWKTIEGLITNIIVKN